MSSIVSGSSLDKNTPSPETLTFMYLSTLNERERKAYSIAKSHLGMSFHLEKSNGYLAWIKEYQKGMTDQPQTPAH